MCDVMNVEQTAAARRQVCKRCVLRGQDALKAVRIPYLLASQLVPPDTQYAIEQVERQLVRYDISELQTLVIDGVPVGQIALASALRFLRRGTPPNAVDEDTGQVLLGYVRSALRIKFLAEAYLGRSRPDFVVMTHGIYVPWGPARAVFQREGIPVACYDQSNVFRNAYVASWNQPSQAYDISMQFAQERGYSLSHSERRELLDYLASRRDNSRDRTRFNFVPEKPCEVVRDELGIPQDALCFGLFTNLLWDAATVSRDICFGNQVKWVIATIEYFATKPDNYLIVRPHPAEELRGTRQAVIDIVREAFPHLPPNVRLVGREPAFNAYSIFNAVDVGIVYTSTVGLEMSLLGKPVIVVADTHYRGKGFTFDPKNRSEYFELIDSFTSAQRISDEQLAEAERYAHMDFLRHHIRLPLFEEDPQENFITKAQLDSDGNLNAWLKALYTQKPFVLPKVS